VRYAFSARNTARLNIKHFSEIIRANIVRPISFSLMTLGFLKRRSV
jgi:hypothetical protein